MSTERTKTGETTAGGAEQTEDEVRDKGAAARRPGRPAKGAGKKPPRAKRREDPDEEPEGGRMSLLSHLKELRRRLIICIVMFLAGVIVCLSQAEWFTNLLLSRGTNFSFVYITPAELMMTYIRVAAAGGIVVAVPVIVYQVWRFVRPGLRRRENLAFGLIMTVGLVLFGLGAAFAFLIVLPLLLAFFARLNTSGTVTAMVSVQEYVAYVVNTMITFGVVFETPMAILALIGTGLVKPKTLRKNFKYAVLVILIVAAVITPPDVVSQLLIAAPLMILFYGSILAGQLIFRRKLKEAEELENG